MKENKITIYELADGTIELKIDKEQETVRANQKQIAMIFSVNSQAITKHIKNIYDEKELIEKQTCSSLEQVQIEGNKQVKRNILHYNLDMIISI